MFRYMFQLQTVYVKPFTTLPLIVIKHNFPDVTLGLKRVDIYT